MSLRRALQIHPLHVETLVKLSELLFKIGKTTDEAD
jgi:hypothetical protein